MAAFGPLTNGAPMRRVLALALVAAAASVPAAAHAAGSGPGWPVTCVTNHTSIDPPSVEGYWLITCIAPIIP